MHRTLIRLLIVCLTIVAAVGRLPGHVVAQATPPVADADRAATETLVRRYYEIAGSGDLGTLTEVVAPDLVIRTAPPGEGSSLESLKETLAAARAGLPDFAFRIDDLIVDGNSVVVRTTIGGTHLGTFFGAPPTGNRIEIPAIDLWRVDDGKLAENWHLEDILGVMAQLAAATGPEGAATPPSANPVATSMTAAGEPGAAPADTAMVQANEALARRFRDQLLEQGTVAVADEILAPGFVWHDDAPPGVGGVKRYVADLRNAFPDLVLTVDRVVAEGDRVAVLWTMSGTHRGEFLGVPATGNRISTVGIDIYRVEDGQIAEVWTRGDDLGLLVQLGAFPFFGDERAATPDAADRQASAG